MIEKMILNINALEVIMYHDLGASMTDDQRFVAFRVGTARLLKGM
jgi:hypothetical protein